MVVQFCNFQSSITLHLVDGKEEQFTFSELGSIQIRNIPNNIWELDGATGMSCNI